MGSSTVIPPPYKGQNYQFPEVSIQSPYCRKMKNFKNKGGAAVLRQGHDMFCNQAVGGGFEGRLINSYTKPTPELFALTDTGSALLRWYDISSGTASLVHSVAAGGDAYLTTLAFNDYLFYFGSSALLPSNSGPQQYTGSAWGAAAYSWPVNTPLGGAVYKNRAYFLFYETASYGYSGINAISGTVTQKDLAGVLGTRAEIYGIATISTTDNMNPNAVLAFLFSSGDVLVYSGSFPDGSDWALASRFRISKPLRLRCLIDAKGDTFVLTESEILSLRNLFVGGYKQERAEGIGAAIQPRWAQIMRSLRANVDLSLVQGVYDEEEDRLVISLPGYVDPDTSAYSNGVAFQLIYDFILGAWYEYTMTIAGGGQAKSACYHNNDVYFMYNDGGGNTSEYKFEAGTTFMDETAAGAATVAIDYHLLTAPLPISKFGANDIGGVEAIMKSDLYPQTNFKFVADLGRQTTGSQPLAAQGTSIAKPMANVGIQGATTVQLDISGSSVTASVGLELNAFNVWYNSGAPGSR